MEHNVNIFYENILKQTKWEQYRDLLCNISIVEKSTELRFLKNGIFGTILQQKVLVKGTFTQAVKIIGYPVYSHLEWVWIDIPIVDEEENRLDKKKR